MATSSSKPAQDQVFINFRGDELHNNFVSHLGGRLKEKGINAFIDTDEDLGQNLNRLFGIIERSKIGLAIFSPRYTESKWCLKELAKMKECMEQGTLVVIPIFYKVEPNTVGNQRGEFGDKFRDLVERLPVGEETKTKVALEWTDALKSISSITGLVVDEKSNEYDVISDIINDVEKKLKIISRASPNPPSLEGLDRDSRP